MVILTIEKIFLTSKMEKFKKVFTKVLISITFVVIFYFSIFLNRQESSDLLQITFFDVGQGDSILIQTPEGKNILVDAGESERIVSLLGGVLMPTIKNLDLVILTHPHNDHLGGFSYLKNYYKFDLVLQEPVEHTSTSYIQWLEYLEENNVTVNSVSQGDIVNLESELSLKILWPEKTSDLSELSLNNTSIVFVLQYKDFKALFTGDVEKDVEQILVDKNIDLEAHLLKAGHHGSNTSSSTAFLDKVLPQTSIISVGADNSFGHPSSEVVENLKSLGSVVYRTDDDGTIKILSDGKTFWKD